MSTLIRSTLIAVALLGTVSAVSATPYYGDINSSGAIDYFNQLTHKGD